MASVLNKSANRVVQRVKAGDPTYSIDPALIAIIIELISQMLPVIMDWCDKTAEGIPEAAAEAIKDRGRDYRFARRQARRAVGGWFNYRDVGGDIMLNAILEEAANTTPEGMEQIHSAIVNGPYC